MKRTKNCQVGEERGEEAKKRVNLMG
jgi:hypothetical protein